MFQFPPPYTAVSNTPLVVVGVRVVAEPPHPGYEELLQLGLEVLQLELAALEVALRHVNLPLHLLDRLPDDLHLLHLLI